jgi:hypothetical protein
MVLGPQQPLSMTYKNHFPQGTFTILMLLLLALTTSCAPYKVPTNEVVITNQPSEQDPKNIADPIEARNHWIYKVVPRHRSQIRWYDFPHWTTWALFGNDDDGIFGEETTSGYHTSRKVGAPRAIAWNARNPGHNLFFYVLGSGKVESEFALIRLGDEGNGLFEYKKEGETVFAGKRHGFFLGFHGWKPFISLNFTYGRQFQFYLGWRERGNFGSKFVPAKKVKREPEEV